LQREEGQFIGNPDCRPCYAYTRYIQCYPIFRKVFTCYKVQFITHLFYTQVLIHFCISRIRQYYFFSKFLEKSQIIDVSTFADTTYSRAPVSEIGRENLMTTFQAPTDSPEHSQSFKTRKKPSVTESNGIYVNGVQHNGVYNNGQLQNNAKSDKHQQNIYCNAQQSEQHSTPHNRRDYDVPCNGRPLNENHYWNAHMDDGIYNLLQETCRNKIVDLESYSQVIYNNNMGQMNNANTMYDTLHNASNSRTDVLREELYNRNNDAIGAYNTLQSTSLKTQVIPDPPYDTVRSMIHTRNDDM